MAPSEHREFAANPQQIPFEEWWRFWHFVAAFEVKDSGPHHMWLVVANGVRTWHVSSPRFHFEYHEADADATGSFRVPITVRLVSAATDISTTALPTTLSLADEGSLMLTSGDATAVFDIPACHPLEWPPREPGVCTAAVSAKRLADVLDVARTPPVGLDFQGYGPPLWCVIGDGKITFHSDWTTYGHGRSTVSVAAHTTGEAAFHSSVSLVARALRDFTTFDDGDATIEFQVDGPDGFGCRVVGPDWTMTCPFLDAVGIEFGGPMRRELSFADIEFTRDGERAVEFIVDGVQVRAHVHGGTHPICRLSTTVARGIECSNFLLGELNEWNKSHAGMKFWWENNKVVAVVDLSCDHIVNLVDEARRLAVVATKLSPATSAL